MNEQIARTIDAAALSGSQSLDLSGLGLKKIPSAVFELSELKQLNLSGNRLKSLTGLAALEALETLNLSGNPLGKLNCFDLPNTWLQSLNLSACQLSQLPSNLERLDDLEKLDLSRNDFSKVDPWKLSKTLSQWVNEISFLKRINLKYCELKRLPSITFSEDDHFNSGHLEFVDVSNNHLENIDLLFQHAPEHINASDNYLKQLPSDLASLNDNCCIEQLNLAHNDIRVVPAAMARLWRLQSLDLSYNKFQSAEVFASENTIPWPSLRKLNLSANNAKLSAETLGSLAAAAEMKVAGNQYQALLNANDSSYFWPERETLLSTAHDRLDLSGQELTELPSGILQLTNLHQLDLSNNAIRYLPESIGQLKALRVLSLSQNQLSTLPSAIGDLPELRHLSLDANQLTAVPNSFSRLNKLAVLSLGNNQLHEWPEAISALPELHNLSVDHNQLQALPASLSGLNQLRRLWINNNQLRGNSKALGELPQLVLLSASDNQLSDIPDGLMQAPQLESVYFDNNSITALQPNRWRQHYQLSLSLDNCPLAELPLELADKLSGTSHLSIDNTPAQRAFGDDVDPLQALRKQAGKVWPGQAVLDASDYLSWDDYYGYIPAKDRGAWPLWIDGPHYYFDQINGRCGFPDENQGKTLQEAHPYYQPITVACEDCDLRNNPDIESATFYVVDLREPQCPVLQWKPRRGFLKLADSFQQFENELLPYEEVHPPVKESAERDDGPKEKSKSFKEEYDDTQLDPHGFWENKRLSRGRFLYHLSITILVAVSLSFGGLAIRNASADTPGNMDFSWWVVPGLIFGFIYISHQFGRRLNDLGHSRWWTIFLTTPGLNAAMFAYLALRKGSYSDNKFGPPCPPFTSKASRILGIVVWLGLAFWAVSASK